MIDLSALMALAAVQRTGSVVAAAEELGYTPSAVSQQVKRLERSLGLDLLERVGRGVLLTEAGRRLVTEGTEILHDLERLRSGLHAAAGTVTGNVRAAVFSTAILGWLATALGELRDRHPALGVTLREREPWQAITDVAGGEADIALVHSWGDVPLSIPDHVTASVLEHDVADAILPPGHALAPATALTPADLVDLEWVATPPGTICRQWLDRMFLGTGRLPRITCESMEFSSHLALVGAGIGVALVPRLGREPLPPGVRAVPVVDPVPTREVSLIHRRSSAGSPAVRAIKEAVERVIAADRARADRTEAAALSERAGSLPVRPGGSPPAAATLTP